MAELHATIDTDQRLHRLPVVLAERAEFRKVVSALQSGRPATIDGAWGSACALAVAALSRATSDTELTGVIVCPDEKAVDAFCDDLDLFLAPETDPEIVRFPAWESDPGERLVYDEIYGDRLRALKYLMGQSPPRLMATSVQSLLQPVPSRAAVLDNTRRVLVGEVVDIQELTGWLAGHGFHSTSAVELPGEFSWRGGILDIFGPDWFEPARVEFFGDEVESIREFDVATQRSLRPLQGVDVTILPAAGDDRMRAATEREHLIRYLPESTWIALIEPEQIDTAARHYIERQRQVGDLLGLTETMQHVGRLAHVSVASLAVAKHPDHYKMSVESVERFSGNVAEIRKELEREGEGREVVVVCSTDAEIQRLGEIFGDTRLVSDGRLHFALGRLSAGFHLADQATLLVSGGQLFQRTELHRRARRHLGKRIDSFLDLRPGDLVVHLAHGIGRYRGMEVLTRENQVEDHLLLEFHGGTKIYVPATKIDLVQKYVGSGKARPRLATIGGTSWVRRRQEAQSAVTDMAVELLDVQAQRLARPGIAMGGDTEWQREFDASFPYDETADQLMAIDAIKSDMHLSRPMDRLLCGDVGFGKTEVAMRATFKAVDNGYQVAILVPTTILAEQHYQTFRERFAEFPFEIARLSRFCTGAEQGDIVGRLAAGQVDIVIGTHRLASKDVRFQNLGLVIIDEEQRFGVEVKERLKSFRSTVDVLTMTATPIPRTLHMSLTGLRDISNLETPPEDRLAVETRITRWDNELLRRAILRELGRDGQVYFVHNRVHDIEIVRKKLEYIVPEASIRVAHGQMAESQLEQVMVEFVTGQFDLLLATTIVESGLDIPNANTIFIDEADRYGLADLHQLRGRVGRYKHRAYCYMVIDGHKHITPEAARRLRAIEEFSQMGAGFAIAMRDLEFRGAGNVLGTRQSGHIAAVGYELYCQMLETAVRRLKRLPPKLSIDVNIDLPGHAILPDDYVPDQRIKIDLYRRLVRVGSEEDLAALAEELTDRFGTPPPPVNRMLALASLRMDAAIWQVATVRLEDCYLVLEYTDAARIRQLAKLRQPHLRIVDDQSAYLTLAADQQHSDSILQVAQSVLRPN